MKEKTDIQNIVSNLPDRPGIYQYFDEHQKLIYIGKAKNLKKRVSSYFNKELVSGKLQMLVRKIADIKYIVDIAANVGFISSFFITVPYMIAQLRLRSLPSYSI